MRYPFNKTYRGELVTDAGPTLRAVIDAVRGGFADMYGWASHHRVTNRTNAKVRGGYGGAAMAIDDLFIECITLDEATGQLTFFVSN